MNNFDNNETNDQDFETMSEIAKSSDETGVSGDAATAGQTKWAQIGEDVERARAEAEAQAQARTTDEQGPDKPPTWLHKGREYPLYPVGGSALQWAATEVNEPGTGKTLGVLSHGFRWENGSPFFEHQAKLKTRSEQLPGNRVKQSQTDTLSADADLYGAIIAEADYLDVNSKEPVQLSRDEVLELCDREDRSRAIRAFFNVTIREIVPEYKTGLDMMRNNKSDIKQYEMLIGDPSEPSAVIVFTMRKAETQARINYEAAVSETQSLRRGDLSIEETSYNLQAQVNFAKKHFISAEGAAFTNQDRSIKEILENAGSTESPERINLATAFLDGLCPRWVGSLGDKHYGSAAKTQGK